ncbi:glycosyltransferase involved in cell wall biosynthesis [Bacillus mesophilus]|uniref:Glycosyltransferase family 2 protein n=1 Tax=Bacillus mesophilus TaxID=1808955 RepID=A0A6M0Q7E4_9BACI|nr:glycosyltransferase family 2 protein [Bacillus mesophilus]MBM7661586.1 glycosyltransferase involved in cell wall biosynthesis [Bacillus mesophilus]NEY72255.1 glycosyltransferase family 2 protein [Bacillus mesophilus]
MSNIRLSICMMVKNEEDNLRRCLTSIQNLIIKNNVELIIIDTGSTDNTVEIAKEYTEKVFFHEWNNSFSEMRNISISYAKGDWIFILDADEELDNEDNLLKMLEADDILQNYNTIQLLLRNFTTNDKKEFSQIPHMRFYRRTKDFKFSGSVHNQPAYQSPIYTNKYLILNHYGYNSQDKQLMDRKFNRTKTMLENELEREPNNIYYRYQLAQSYSMHNEFENGYKEIVKAYKLLRTNEQKKSFGYVYLTYVNICLQLSKFYEAIEISNEGCSFIDDFIDLYFVSAVSKLKIGMHDGLQEEVDKYLFLFEHLSETTILQNGSIELFRITLESRDLLLRDYSNYLLNRNEDISKKYILMINDALTKDRLLARYYMISENYKSIVELLSLYNNEELHNMIKLIEQEVMKKDKVTQNKIYKIFSSNESLYGRYNFFRISDSNNKKEYVKDFERNLDEIINFPIYWDIFSYLIELDMDRFFNLLKKAQSLKIKEIAKYVINENHELYKTILEYLTKKTLRVNDLHGNRVFLSLAAAFLLEVNKKADSDNYFALYSQYIEAGVNYTKTIFKPEIIKLTYNTLDDSELKLFMIYTIIQELINNKNINPVLKLYKEAVLACPFYSDFLELEVQKLEETIFA